MSFTDIGAGLPGVSEPSVAWGDYDNDGDLDILLTGQTASVRIARIYRNDAGTFTDIVAGLAGVAYSSVAWGDYDNDGDLDILLTGFTSFLPGTRLYRNDAGTFTAIAAELPDVYDSSVAWGDYDNDGDLDILLTGDTGSGYIARIYRNHAGMFTDTGAALINVAASSVAWGDFDNDGDLDILISCSSGNSARVYRNDAGTFVDTLAVLPGVYNSSVAWGDYDNDGDLDVLFTGGNPLARFARVYRNDAGTFSDIVAGLPGVDQSSAAWGDYDNDGDLDILITGDTGSGSLARVYRNDAGSFADIAAGLPSLARSSVAWGDYENDGDLDILLTGDTGSGYIARVYRNDGAAANTPPAAPTGLAAVWLADRVTFSWSASADAETPNAGLSYSLRVGTTPGGSEISVAMADATTGYRQIPALGNANQNQSWTIKVSPQTLYWTVQAVDGALTGSAFAPEASTIPVKLIDIGAGLPGVAYSSAAWGDYDNDGDLDILLTGAFSNGGIARVYRNDAGTFADIGAGLPGVFGSSAAWGDYDNDADLDILLTGYSSNGGIARVYRNDAGTFADIGAGLPGVGGSSVAWGDCDNDGDLDILLTGNSSNGGIARVYRNDAGTFADIGAGLPGVDLSSVAWGDYDNDGDLDILLTGNPGIARVYRNDAGAFTDIDAGLPGVAWSSVAWGDYDNDGDLDILLSGAYPIMTRVYRNDAGTYSDIGAGLPGVASSSVAWLDYDNDGDLDILLSGDNIEVGYNKTRVFRNDAGTFTNVGSGGMPDVHYSSLACGDYDNDGDLDVLLTGETGSGFISRVYRTDGAAANTPPSAPTGLAATWAEDTITFSWAPAIDAETPTPGLTYNLRVGTTPGGSQVSAAMVDANTGYRRIPALGNANLRLSLKLKVDVQTLYWSVQAVDGALAGSALAPEASTTPPPGMDLTDIDAGLPGVAFSSVAWGDYDNDGDLDILLTGNAASGGIARVYRNEGGAFADIGAGLPGVWLSSAAWGDFDSDGDLDILLTGDSGGGVGIARVYRNDAGAFADIGAGLPGVDLSSVAWGDYDNDGDLDILLTGSGIARVYRNDAGTFSDIGAGLPGVESSSVAWGDYDNDGDLDILLTGDSGGVGIARLYRNDVGAFADIGAVLPGVAWSSVAWGDYDNDGDLDILLTGQAAGLRIARIYRNDAGTFSDIGAGLPGVASSSVAWLDYDNDGDLDILLSGRNIEGGDNKTRMFRNDAGTFTNLGSGGMPDSHYSSLACGDYDNDGDLDVLLTGYTRSGFVSRVYRNNGEIANTPPEAPTGLVATWSASSVTLSWDPAVDTRTPGPGLSYNLRVGTTPGGSEIIATMADGGTGYRRIPALGNSHQALGRTFQLTPRTLYWSVQAVDAAYAGSPFAAEESPEPTPLMADIDAGLPGVAYSSVAWGDYDNDGDLDILLTGQTGSAYVARVYRNNAGKFTNIGAGLPGVATSSAAWGDYDNDGDLDILVTGSVGSGYISRVYRNEGGTFADIGAGLPGVANSSAAWGDYDNDGDLDILLTGYSESGSISRVYRNEGGTFADIGAGLPGAWRSSAAWGDYDNDGDLDILLTGDSGGVGIARVYRNDAGAFTDIGAGLPGVAFSSVAWGDYDNDGDLDILLSGAYPIMARVYRNDAGAFSDIGAGLPGVASSSVAWGDYDNDGDLDILLSGDNLVVGYNATRIFRNHAGKFTDIGAGLPDAHYSSVAWGDYDNDRDLDILLTGLGNSQPLSLVYRNDGAIANTPPGAPAGLQARWSGNTVTFSWNAASDTETPGAGLSYNLRVGTTPGGSEISAAMADGTTGYRWVPALGNAQHRLSWTLGVDPQVLYWSVQAVDAGCAGSPFGAEMTANPSTGVVENGDIPIAFALYHNAPNPIRAQTSVRFALPVATAVTLRIFDVQGRLVRTLYDAPLPAGVHAVTWDRAGAHGQRVASGIYWCRLTAGDSQAVRQMVVLH